MGDTTKIEWADHTASPWYGCSHAVLSDGSEHEGCANCYAEALAKRNPAILGVWGTEGTRVKSKSFSRSCEAWNKQAERDGVRRSVFPSLCDPFESLEAWDGPLNSWRAGLFSVIDNCPWLDFLLLTKRPQNIRKMWLDYSCRACITGDCPHWSDSDCLDQNTKYRENVWLLASVSDQRTADELIPELLACRDLVPVLGLSMEPLLGLIDLGAIGVGEATGNYTNCLTGETCFPDGDVIHKGAAIDWGIVGGESGPNARPMHPDWARSIRDQCQAAGVPFHFKQFGEYLCDKIPDDFTGAHANCIDFLGRDCAISYANGERWEAHAEKSIWSKCGTYDRRWVIAHKVGKKAAGRELDGRTWDEFPKAGAP